MYVNHPDLYAFHGAGAKLSSDSQKGLRPYVSFGAAVQFTQKPRLKITRLKKARALSALILPCPRPLRGHLVKNPGHHRSYLTDEQTKSL